jgi:hypothetical protein
MASGNLGLIYQFRSLVIVIVTTFQTSRCSGVDGEHDSSTPKS